MSLKAKIEAIIYAAEEPVTLEQIATVLGDTALPTIPSAPQEKSDGSDNPVAETAAVSEASVSETSASEPNAPEPEPNALGSPEPASVDADSESPNAPPPLLEAATLDEKAKAKKIKENIRLVIDALTLEYEQSDRAMEIRHIAGGYRMSTKPEHHDVIRAFAKSLKPPMKFSLQALETLAVVAYKQPVTAPEISEIRGVDCAGVLGGLISRKLITTAGRKQVIGRPILYKTTKDFLLRFGLNDLSELPSMGEFEKLASENTDLLFEEEPSADAIAVPGTEVHVNPGPETLDQDTQPAASELESDTQNSAAEPALEEHPAETSRE